MRGRTYILSIIIFILMVNTDIIAQRDMDVEGGKDHPLISRFEGSVMEYYDHKNYDQYTLVLGFEGHNADSTLDIEGEITRIQYSTTGDHSVFEIYKNFEIALKEANFKTLFTWSDKEPPPPEYTFWRNVYYSSINKIGSSYSNPDGRMGFRYHVAHGINEGKNVYVVLFVSSDDDVDWILTTLDVIEEKEMKTGLVTARAIEKGLEMTGHAVLSGIYFDTGKSTIKAESDAALNNIVNYLRANPGKKLFIVGHTDNEGDFQSNMVLSEERAKAVMNELVSQYGVKAGQVEAHGVSSLSPVSSNSTDDGRARNRRVEIVEHK